MADVKIIAAKASGTLARAAAVLSGESGIFSTLRGEHEQLRSLMNRLLATSDDAPGVRVRLGLIDFIRNEVIAHARAEERELYALVPAEGRLEEHREIEQWVEELLCMPPTDPMWMASFESFVATVERHIRHEEELFESARGVISDEQARQIDQLYKEEKMKELAALRSSQ